MDYILFIRAPPGGVSPTPNPEEVDDVRCGRRWYEGMVAHGGCPCPMRELSADALDSEGFGSRMSPLFSLRRFVSQEDLSLMMRPESGLRWSPWFRWVLEGDRRCECYDTVPYQKSSYLPKPLVCCSSGS